jgi:hypothetical protein
MDNARMSRRNRIASVIELEEVADRWKEVANERSVSLVPLVVAILLLSLSIACTATAGGGEQQVCDVGADYALGVEDYPQAISLHGEVVRKHPDNALAHYHLGFAEGMMGNRTAESPGVSAFRRAWTEKLGFVPEPGVGSARKR